MPQPTLTLYYDGLCPLCHREIIHYQRCAKGDPSIVYLDFTDPQFDPAAHGLDVKRIHEEMHVREGEVLFTGVEAFIVIWRRIPGHWFMTFLTKLPGGVWFMKLGYRVFAAIRPMLPRRKRDCDTGTCQR